MSLEAALQLALVDSAVRVSEVEWQEDVEGIRVREIRIENRRWALVEYAPGALRRQWCEDGHLGVVIAGEIVYEFEDGAPPLSARQGDAFTLSTSRGHRGRNPGGTATIVFVIDDPA